MIKKIIFVTFLFIGLSSFGQDINELRKKASSSSDSELVVFIQKAKDQGLSLMDAEKQLILIGGKADEIKKLRDLWNKKLPKKSETDLDDTNKIESQFGETEGFVKDSPSQDVEDEVKRFGSDFFKNKNIVESPQLFVATPSDYRLGPGDDLIINLFGASEITYSVQISRNGNVKFDKLAPVYLSGLSIRSASKRLKERLSKIYTGLNSNNPIEKVDLELSLQKARSIVVNITGQVEAPGTYTISGFSSVLNALFAAGGPNKIGSFRNIKLLRNGKVNKKIDLYDYFVTGLYPNVYLRDQDVILVEAYSKQVDLTSGFKINGLFELKENEVIDDVLKFSGGFSSDSYKEKIFVNRINSSARSVVEFSKEKFSESELIDGDILTAKTVSGFIANSVSIEGSVFIPGVFDLSKVLTVGELINASKGIMPDASNFSILYRTNKGVENEVISINLSDENDLKIKLFDQDRLVIFSLKAYEFTNKISVIGEVNNPDIFDYKSGMTVRDAIQLSNSFTDNSDKTNIKIIRNISLQNLNIKTEEFFVNFSDELNFNNFELFKDDIVVVAKKPFLESTQFYSVKGQASIESSYSISNDNYSVKDAFREKIILKSNSSPIGIYVERDNIKIPIEGKKVSQYFEPQTDLELVNGDIIFIPVNDNTITISGSVQQESIISYKKSIDFKKAISASGGLLENSDLKRAFVEYQNGQKKSVKSFLGIKTYPKLLPGSKIFVPEKIEERNKTSVGEIVGYTTSLVSIIALIKSL